jgi:hypothetical protein
MTADLLNATFAFIFYAVTGMPVISVPAIRFTNHKVGGIRFIRVGRLFCSFGVSR